MANPYRLPRRHPRILLEARAPFELGGLVTLGPLLRTAPRGQGRPVLVLPGLTASDVSTRPLRAALRRQGHHVHGWRLGRNEGPTPRVLSGLAERFEELSARHGGAVSIVGWSLGGVYAVALARAVPGLVDRVVTLGSPLRILDDPRIADGELRDMIRGRLGDHPRIHPVPTTSIWSRTDAVVAARAARLSEDPRTENVEVVASHFGIGMNAAAVWVVLDRLGQDPGRHEPFEPPAALRWAYPARRVDAA